MSAATLLQQSLAAQVGNASTQTQQPSDSPGEELDGYADIHVHEMANYAFGGSIIWGSSNDPKGLGTIPPPMRRGHDALEGATHGRFVAVLLRTLVNAYLGDWFRHGEEGDPSFRSWPSVNIWTHQQVYKDWLFRAYQGGLRLMVMLAENSEDANGRGENELPIVRHHVFQRVKALGRSGNDMESLDWQIRGAYLLQAEIDNENGGPGRGWYRIVRDPDEAADVISQGKLAVILGTELQHLFNCDMDRPRCTPQAIVEGLNRLESMGVNYVFPLHHKLNQYGGPARFTFLNDGPSMKCPESKPRYEHDCSAVGLTELGKFLMRELSARGMLIDVEHMSLKTFNDAMNIVEQRHYPVFAGHVIPFDVAAKSDRTERAKTRAQLQRIFDVGGIVAPMMGTSFDSSRNHQIPITCKPYDGGGVDQWANAYLFVKNIAGPRSDQLAFGSDWNGFAGWPRPRKKCASPNEKLSYPYPLPPRLRPAAIQPVTEMSLFQWPPGGRTWDFNEVGAAHVGMEPDFLQDTQLLLPGLTNTDLEPIYRSARAIVNLWSRTRHNSAEWSLHHLRWAPQSSFETFTFKDSFDPTRNVEALLGFPICRSRNGHKLGFLQTDECHLVEASSKENKDAVQLAAYHDGKCLTEESWTSKPLVQRACGEMTIPMQGWYVLDLKSDRKMIADNLTRNCLSSNGAGQPVIVKPCITDHHNQVWLPERRGNMFLLIDNDGLCLEVKDQSRADGAQVELNTCTGASNQLWSVEALRQNDYETLYQADKQRYAWVRNPPDPHYPHAVEVDSGRQICRAKDVAWLGVIYGEECSGNTYGGKPFVTTEYEGLFQAP